jgi:hypothetical protein
METNIIYRQADMAYRTDYLTHRGRRSTSATAPSERRSHHRGDRPHWWSRTEH